MCHSTMIFNRNKMLYQSVILLLLVGAAFTDPSFGWESGKQYTYYVRSRTLAAFNLQSKQYTGIVIEGQIIIQPSSQNTLRAQILYPKYSQVHTRLENGWDSQIPPSQLNIQKFPLSGEPFEIKTKNGVIEDLIVNRDIPTWEVNVIKSIVSQLQLDTLGQNAEQSRQNQLPEDSHPYAMFRVMEDTITGRCEVMYDISPLPQHLNKRKIVPMPWLRENGEIISIIKTKNYSNCDQRIAYHFGIEDTNKWEPGSNENGNYLFRSSVSRVIISGNLEKYTIQSSVTTNKVVQNADLQENEQGIVASRVNLTLHEVKDITDQVPAPSNPQSIGSLVYTYNNPAGEPSSRRSSKYVKHEGRHQKNSAESGEDLNEYDVAYNMDENSYLLPKPTLMKAPLNPLFSYFVGYHGNSIQKNSKIDAIRTAKSLAQEIGNDIQKPDSMFEEQTLDKFIILCKLIRTMSAEQIAEAQKSLYQSPHSHNQLQQSRDNLRRNAWLAFRDAVANAGTGPALVNVKQWIQNNQIEDYEVAKIVDNVARTARTPTSEYVDKFYEMVTMQEIKKNHELQESAVLSFANFLRYAVVDKQSAHNRYPIHTYGKLISKDNRNVEDKYIPYLAEELKAAVNKGDSQKVLLYTVAIGQTGHPRILAVFEPYLEGKKPISLHQRLIMVFALRPIIATHPKVARSVLYKIYSNNADHHEIRTAAALLLSTTNPPASMLQRMAEYTNYDSNKHVNSAVKSLIQSFAVFDKSKAALALLNPENYGFQYSHMQLMNFENLVTKSKSTLGTGYIGSDDSVIPKVAYADYSTTLKGLKMPKFTLAMSVSSVRNLFDFIMQKLNPKNDRSDQKTQQQKYSPENIAKYLNINGNEPHQIEGLALLQGFYQNHLLTFDNHTIEKMYEKINQTFEKLRDGKNCDEAILNNYEIAISFPTETGFPYHFSLKLPTIVLFNAYAKLKTDSSSDSQSSLPNSASVSGKSRIMYNTGIQKRVGFVTPFEHQEYVVGIDRNLQVHLPIRSEFEYDKIKKYLKVKVQPNEDEGDFKILQYSTQPFTAKHDILSLQPIKKDENTYIIHKNSAKSSQIEYSDPQNNNQILQFNWETVMNQGKRENKLQNAFSSFNKLMKSASYMFYPTNDDAEYQKYSVQLSPPRDVSVEVRFSYDSQTSFSINNAENSESKPQGKAPHLQKNFTNQERKQKLLNEATKNINSAQAEAIDISVRLNKLNTSVDMTAAVASSNVDKKSRALIHVYANLFEELDYHLAAGVESKIPNLDFFDYEETLKANVPQEYDAEIHFGVGTSENSGKDNNRIKINGKVQLTEDRKNQIRQSRAAQECSKQVYQNGNKLSPSCHKANKRAAFINSGDFTITLNKESTVDRVAMEALDIVELLTKDLAEVEKDNEDKQENKKIKVSFITSQNDNEVDLSIKTPKGRTEFKNIRIDYDDENIKSTQDDDYKEDDIKQLFESTCSIDKSQIYSFDNHQYHLHLGQCWHVAVTSYPKNNPDKPTQHSPIPENMKVAILTRENEYGQKDLKIMLGDIEIDLAASGHRQIQVKVNGKKVHYSKEESHVETKKGVIVYELFELSDKSVKLVSHKFDIELFYDGERTQIKAGNRYRDSVRGLCGNNDGEWENDQQTPEGYLLQKSEEFSATYALINDNQCTGPARQYAEKAKTAERIYQYARPGNVISDKEAGRSSYNDNLEYCSVQRTKVLKSENEICFSLKPVTTCSPKCKPTSMKFMSIQYHCVPRNVKSEKVAQRVENGVNPDLRQKVASKTENQQIPVSCKV